MRRTAPILALVLALAGCGDPAAPASRPSPSAPSTAPAPGVAATPAAPTDHGAAVDLGRLTLAGHELTVVRLGDVVPGKEGAFEVDLVKAPAGITVGSVGLYAWVEAQEGGPASAPAKASVEGGRLHVHVTARADAPPLKRIVLRLRYGAIDERGSLPLDGHGHEHGPTPHEGVVAAFHGPEGVLAGHLELKLHDDKGDLELWLATDAAIKTPFDLPVTATVRVHFVDVGNRIVELRVRNTAGNEDEAGVPNVRDGRTNYFIFPGETGADAAWLVGAGFASIVKVTFEAGGRAYTSEEFMLVPHTHADGHGHK